MLRLRILNDMQEADPWFITVDLSHVVIKEMTCGEANKFFGLRKILRHPETKACVEINSTFLQAFQLTKYQGINRLKSGCQRNVS